MRVRHSLSMLVLTLLIGCKATVIWHDENQASRRATEFAELAFVQRNFKEAYTMLAPDFQKELSLAAFGDLVLKMHPRGFPSATRATDFQPVPGEQVMGIYVEGTNGGDTFYYRFTMEGTRATNYAIGGMYRNTGPYPAYALRQKLSSS